jgi:hypothetical protein
MGTNPYKEKMPNRGMGREMGKDEDDESQDVNVQEIGTDPQIPGPGTDFQRGLGTNFTHVKTSKTVKDDSWVEASTGGSSGSHRRLQKIKQTEKS